MKILIFGKGHVGRALAQFHTIHDVVCYHDPLLNLHADYETTYEVAHITYPMGDIYQWVKTTQQYMKAFAHVEWWMIHSSIDPQALDYLPMDHYIIVYSPIRATEAIMEEQVAQTRKYWAFLHTPKEHLAVRIAFYIKEHFPNPLQFDDAYALALGKLIEVAEFGLLNGLVQNVHRLCLEKGWSFHDAYTKYRPDSQFGKDYSQLKEGEAPSEWIPRPILRPDIIGGRCVIQDIDLLLDGALGDTMPWIWVKASNEKEKRRRLSHG